MQKSDRVPGLSKNISTLFSSTSRLKGPLKYLLIPLLGKNQFAITLHMCASIAGFHMTSLKFKIQNY